MPPLPMFPLGTVLFPSAVLPLHVFEPRYRALVRDCLAGERELGVVLIERGSEVGGGDVRSDVGTVAHIVRADELPDGRWGLVTVGARRFRVREWLPDAPYPLADVEEWLDPEPDAGYAAQVEAVLGRLRRVLALASEAGDQTAPATLEVSDDPVLALHQAGAVAPLGPLDKQRVLAAPTPDARATVLGDALADAEEILLLRLGG